MQLMKKILFLIFPLLNTTYCATDDDEYYGDTFCWQCQSEQEGEQWTDYFHNWTQQEINDLISDDSRETPAIYTRCYRLACYEHDGSY